MTGPRDEGSSEALGPGGGEGWVVSKACHPWKPPAVVLLAPSTGTETPDSSKVDHPCSCGCAAAGAAGATAGAPPVSTTRRTARKTAGSSRHGHLARACSHSSQSVSGMQDLIDSCIAPPVSPNVSQPLCAGGAAWPMATAGALISWAGAPGPGDSSRSIKLPASDVVRAVSEAPW